MKHKRILPAKLAAELGAQSADVGPKTGTGRPPRVCCIVLTWNNYVDTDECLRSLEAVDYRPLQIVVVNNASTDDSIDRLKARWSEVVTFVDSGSNESIPFGYNRGFAEALSLGADYVCQVDNDVVVEPGFVDTLLKAIKQSATTAMAAPIMLNYYKPELIWYAGSSYNRALGLTFNHHSGKPLTTFAKLGTTFRTDFAPTCAVMVSRTALQAVGFLDERLAFSHDDVDWCLRAAALGLQCVVVGQPLARHKIAVTRGFKGSNVQRPRSAHDMAMSSYLVGQKYLRGVQWVPFLFGRLVLSLPYQCGRMALAGAWPSAFAYCRGTLQGLASCFLGRSSRANPEAEVV